MSQRHVGREFILLNSIDIPGTRSGGEAPMFNVSSPCHDFKLRSEGRAALPEIPKPVRVAVQLRR